MNRFRSAPAIGLLVAGLAAGAAVDAQTLYRSTGPDGQVVYSDRPPVQGSIDKTLKFENLPASEVPAATLSYVEQLRRMRARSPAAAQPTEGTVLYAAAWCGYCRKAKAYLAGRGIAYREIDIDTPGGKEAFAVAGGGKGIPLIVAQGQRVRGFSPAAYDALFAGK